MAIMAKAPDIETSDTTKVETTEIDDEVRRFGTEHDYLQSVVKIEYGSNEGTAVCVHSSDTIGQLYLTCAHVVQHKTQSVILRHSGRVIRGTVIYATPKDIPHDIAVIVSRQAADITPCQILDKHPTVRQKVYTVGYGCKENFTSTVFGKVSSVSIGILTSTCHVREGFSGGPVFTTDGKLMGLTIGKLSVGTVTFVLPVTEFLETIKTYIHTNNLKVLNGLESKCPLKKIFWNNKIPILNVCHI